MSPSWAALSLLVMSRAAAPSEIWEALPAWTTPSSRETGRSAANFSTVPPRRIPSSPDTIPAALLTGTIWAANRPSSWAAAAFSCDLSEYSSSCWRDSPHSAVIISAPMPWFGKASPYRSL